MNKKRISLKILLYLLIISSTSCIEKFDFNGDKTKENLLVVDGFISNGTEPSVVYLSRTSEFVGLTIEGGYALPERNAIVKIIDDDGNEELLHEEIELKIIHTKNEDNDSISFPVSIIREGKYVSNAGFRGQIGKTYHLYVKTLNSDEYISTPEKMLAPKGEIDSFYFNLGSQEKFDPETGKITYPYGLKFYTDLTLPVENTYYILEWLATYKVKMPFDTNDSVCYANQYPVNQINIINSKEENVTTLPAHHIAFFPLSNKFDIGFSIILKQYSVSKDAFEFKQLLKNQLDSKGTIFDPIPSKITGNVKKLNGEEEVLGHFGTRTLQERRIFILPKMIDGFEPRGYSVCGGGATPEGSLAFCFDCTKWRGGTRKKPDYWD